VQAISTAVASLAIDSLGCSAIKLHDDQELHAAGMSFYRKRVDDSLVSQVFTPASDRGFLIGVSLSGGHRRSIYRGGRPTRHEFDRGAVYVRDFSENYRADLDGKFDFLLFELSASLLAGVVADERGARVSGLKSVTGEGDPVLAHLAQAIAPALARPGEASMLFVEQLGTAIATYLGQRYGGAAQASPRQWQGLSPLHEARAKQMLLDKSKGSLSIAGIAQECNMSASYFLRAFRVTTGRTPHQWLLLQRVAQARELLLHSHLSLAEIAVACQFSDQSHFNRVFSQLAGTPPGNWRRNARG